MPHTAALIAKLGEGCCPCNRVLPLCLDFRQPNTRRLCRGGAPRKPPLRLLAIAPTTSRLDVDPAQCLLLEGGRAGSHQPLDVADNLAVEPPPRAHTQGA